MIDRFRQSPRSHSSRLSSDCAEGVACLCCAALQRAQEMALFDALPEWGSPLTPGVQVVNLSHNGDGTLLRVDLADDWTRMFSQLPLVGLGLVMTRNEAAILGQRMSYPGVVSKGDLRLDFVNLGAARAVHLRREAGHLFGAEFYDGAGHTIHRFTTSTDSDLDAFFDWVRLHQACSVSQGTPSAGRAAARPIPHEPASVVRSTDTGSIVSIFTACCERGLPIRATVHAGPVVQSTCFVPESLQSINGWWFASSEGAGVHFHTGQINRVDVAHSHHASGSHLQLRAHTETCEPALVLEPAPDATGLLSSTWHDLLHVFA